MSERQRRDVERMLASSPLNIGGDVQVQRKVFEEMLTAATIPRDVGIEEIDLAGVPAHAIGVVDQDICGTILLFHGGGFVMGSARASWALAAEVARRTRTRVIAVGYRLAPEHPHPAARCDAVAAYRAMLDTGVPQSQILVAGESAGGALALGLVIDVRDRGLAPPAGLVLMSPWLDLTLGNPSMTSKAEVDLMLGRGALERRVADYLPAGGAADPQVSPLFADLTGLPPTLVQVGTHETLLDDAVRVVAKLAAADVTVHLDAIAGMPHVFQAFAPILDEAAEALDRVGIFVTHVLQSA